MARDEATAHAINEMYQIDTLCSCTNCGEALEGQQASVSTLLAGLARGLMETATVILDETVDTQRKQLKHQAQWFEVKLDTARKATGVQLKNQAQAMEETHHRSLEETTKSLTSGGSEKLAEAQKEIEELTARLDNLHLKLVGSQEALSASQSHFRATEARLASTDAAKLKLEAESTEVKKVLHGSLAELHVRIGDRWSLAETLGKLVSTQAEAVARVSHERDSTQRALDSTQRELAASALGPEGLQEELRRLFTERNQLLTRVADWEESAQLSADANEAELHRRENERVEEMAGARAEQARLDAELKEAIDARDEALEERDDACQARDEAEEAREREGEEARAELERLLSSKQESAKSAAEVRRLREELEAQSEFANELQAEIDAASEARNAAEARLTEQVGVREAACVHTASICTCMHAHTVSGAARGDVHTCMHKCMGMHAYRWGSARRWRGRGTICERRRQRSSSCGRRRQRRRRRQMRRRRRTGWRCVRSRRSLAGWLMRLRRSLSALPPRTWRIRRRRRRRGRRGIRRRRRLVAMCSLASSV